MPIKSVPGFLLLAILMTIDLTLSGQTACGVSDADQRSWIGRYQENIRHSGSLDLRSENRALPIVFHLLGRDNGTGRPPLNNVLDLMCSTANLLDSAGFDLYLIEGGVNIVDNEGVYFQHHLAGNQQTMRTLKMDSAVNVFVVADAGSGSTGSVLGYYDLQDDWIVISRNQIKSGNVTLAHEIGHFLSLVHTHFGWDGQPWQASIHGPKAPLIAPNGVTETEKMDGSNCLTAGDQLCDTPPDYNIGLSWTQSCTYNGDARDPDSVALDPDETQIMSYFSDACRAVFSAEQMAIMQTDWDSPARAFLRRSYVPSADTISDIPQLLMPTSAVQTSTGDLSFSWTKTAGATHYLLQVDRAVGFNLSPRDFIVADTFFTLSGPWIEQTSYFWRIFAFHESATCLAPSVPSTFSVETITGLSPELTPPTWRAMYDQNNQTIRVVDVEPGSSFELVNLEGKIICSMREAAISRNRTFTFQVSHLPAGLYIIRDPRYNSLPQKIVIR
ncbi:MAG: hypothetical protein NWR72_04775 [Bacteroidia bacterium]|nr:hypothetical protein [Bacteroidia bacterium]